MFQGQLGHLVGLAVLVGAVYALRGAFDEGSFLGLTTATWAWLAVANAIAHQAYVWFCWRAELRSQLITRTVGFRAYAIVFAVLILLRPILVFATAWSNRGTIAIPPWLGYGIAAVLFALSGYLGYSTIRYFGFARATGEDHFDPEARSRPFVRKGMYLWTSNAQYVFGFLALWAPAFLFRSRAALVVAGFSHAYIWVHYLCTERPDMKRIYSWSAGSSNV